MHPRLTIALFASTHAQRRQLRLLALFCAALLLLVAPGIAAAATPVAAQQSGDSAAGATVNVGDSSLGQILVDAKGMTLYMFDKDEPGKSNCDAACLRRWPPLLAEGGAQPVGGAGVSATLGTIQRDDGTAQITANNMPLYYWFEDKQPGDVLGQAVGDVWWVLAPDGTPVHTAAAAGDTGQASGTGGATATGSVTSTDTMTDTAASTNTATAGTTATGTTATMTDTTATDTTATTGTSVAGADVITNTGSTGDTSTAPQQMPVTGADGGTLSALLSVLAVAAGGGWVALRNRKR
jgi:predicted lipoprotein with Yx(FWY)xxD motif